MKLTCDQLKQAIVIANFFEASEELFDAINQHIFECLFCQERAFKAIAEADLTHDVRLLATNRLKEVSSGNYKRADKDVG